MKLTLITNTRVIDCQIRILKLEDRKLKHSIQINRKVLQQKSLKLSQLKYSDKLIISENMCYEK